MDGKKVVIGGVIVIAVVLCKLINATFTPVFDPSFLNQVNDTGLAFLAVGLAHKAVKQM